MWGDPVHGGGGYRELGLPLWDVKALDGRSVAERELHEAVFAYWKAAVLLEHFTRGIPCPPGGITAHARIRLT